ncbi:uncharacterized protein LOC143248387 [Tachypleus tridentatus]|uniref:uncharacterized protein LOC143248387 n=1 Tax=Tachypleus tridentatus TaxID=6853 RepID=UPI003FD66E31
MTFIEFIMTETCTDIAQLQCNRADDGKKKSRYPTPRQYDQVVDKIFKRYPQLSDAPNLTPQGIRELWRLRVRQKFQNNRKQKDSSLPIAQERKKRRKLQQIKPHFQTTSQNRGYMD